jgi:hypothetical protein
MSNDYFRGCVTPKQIENLVETCGGDTDMVDGYDELPAEFQEKIEFALENGHIPDEDCTRVSIFPHIPGELLAQSIY